MTILHRCINCQEEFDLPDKVGGKKIRCHRCQQVQAIPLPIQPSNTNDEPLELDQVSERQDRDSPGGPPKTAILLLLVLALPVIGFGSWTIYRSIFPGSHVESSTDRRQVTDDDEGASEQIDRGLIEEPVSEPMDEERFTRPGKIVLGGADASGPPPTKNLVEEIDLGKIVLQDRSRLFDEFSALAGTIGLNWIYVFPEGELASQGFPEIDHREKVEEVYGLAEQISDQRLRRVVREAARSLDRFPDRYTEIRGDASFKGAIVTLLGRQIVKAQFLAMNRLLEGLLRISI